MGLFRKKKQQKRSVLDRPVLTSREYRIYKSEHERKRNWYENLAKLASSILVIKAGGKSAKELSENIFFADLRIRPEDVMSLVVSTVIMFAIIGIAIIISGIVPVIGGITFIALGGLAAYYLYNYPKNRAKNVRINASSQIVLAVLYMVVSMRVSPNLERALRFAAANITGELAKDLRRLIWDIEMGKYYSAEEALDDYIVRWKTENEEFSEALRLLKESQRQSMVRGKAVLDQALEVVLDGTKTRMKHYAQDLRTPVMVIHMMGIVLPILGTIMAPLAAVFMADLVQPWHFVLGYNIALPIIILWFINNTLNKRPVTFSRIDISNHPDLPKKGTFRLGKRDLPVLPLALGVLFLFLAPALMFFMNNPELLMSGTQAREFSVYSIAMSCLMTLGVGFSMAFYFILGNYQSTSIQSDIQKIEKEFELALFQLGNKIAGGTPTEVAVEKAMDDLKDTKIYGLFQMTLMNIRNMGMTFEQALFHRKYGSLKYYPSRLIKNIMYAVTDTARKGITYASESMLRISRYLQNIRETQEYIRDILEETVSSMKFQAYFLTPLITGLIVSMSEVIVQVLSKLGEYLDEIGVQSAMGLGDVASAFGNMDASTSPEVFQLIVGFYLVEMVTILAIFLTKIDQGDNKQAQWYLAGKMIIVGLIIYFIVAIGASTIFGELIKDALSSLLV